MKKTIFILLLLTSFMQSKAMTIVDTIGVPVVGQPCGDLFFNKTINFNKASFYLHELRGKWVVLDLWDEGCSGCIASFPHVSEMQRNFKDKVQFLMVTFDDYKGHNRDIYTHYNKMLHLEMPCVFNGTDNKGQELTGIFKQFDIHGLPFTVIIDPSGIIRVVTYVASREKLQELINGKLPVFEDRYHLAPKGVEKIEYDGSKPFLVDGNGGKSNNFEYRSLISKASPGLEKNGYSANFFWERYRKNHPISKLECIAMPLIYLYKMAYFGGFNLEMSDSNFPGHQLYWPEPILEMKDSSLFVFDEVSNKNRFCYSSSVPSDRGTKELMLEYMQDDLKRYFGYQASIEIKKMPCYKLVIINPQLANQLETTGGKHEVKAVIPRLSYKGTNCPMTEFFKWVEGFYGKEGPFIDETGIKTNIDFSFEAPYGSFEGTNKGLKKMGLKIVQEEKEIKVLVVRDPEPVRAQTGNN